MKHARGSNNPQRSTSAGGRGGTARGKHVRQNNASSTTNASSSVSRTASGNASYDASQRTAQYGTAPLNASSASNAAYRNAQGNVSTSASYGAPGATASGMPSSEAYGRSYGQSASSDYYGQPTSQGSTGQAGYSGSYGQPAYGGSSSQQAYNGSYGQQAYNDTYGQQAYGAPSLQQISGGSDGQPYQGFVSSNSQLIDRAKKRRMSAGKRAALIIGVILVALLASAGAFYLWFTTSLNDSLERNTDKRALDVLTKVASGEPFYVLVLASDERHDEHNADIGQYTDVMMLVRVDTKENKVTMLSIPRDTRYVLEDGSIVKMNDLYNIGGVRKCIQGVSELTGLPISHYAMVYMSDLKNVVDELGGVEIDVQIEINNNDPETEENVNVQPGLQTLDGLHAQAYAISRHEADTNEDAYRQGKVRTLLGAIINKVLSLPAFEIPGMVIKLSKYVETDMRSDDLLGLVAGFSDEPEITIYEASGPSEGDIDESADGMWLCYEDPEGWAEVVRVMDSGGDPSTVTYKSHQQEGANSEPEEESGDWSEE